MPQTNVKHWRRLDNAAKLFPAASSKRDTRVFRFYCELKEDIQQEILQKAVDRTLEKYPIFLSVLRKSFAALSSLLQCFTFVCGIFYSPSRK